MASSLIPPLNISVPIVDPKTGCPMPDFQRMLQTLLLSAQLSITNGTIGIAAGGVGTTELADNAVTYAKIQDVTATKRVLGRNSAGAGDPEEVTVDQLLDWIAGTAAQGDVFFRGASGAKRLPAGTTGQFLQTKGASNDPVWASSGGGSVTLIAEYVGDGTTGTHTFSSIPGTYRSLKLVWTARSDVAATSDAFNLQFNSDTAGNYDRQIILGSGTTANASESLAGTSIVIGALSGSTAPSGAVGSGEIIIPTYADTTFHKTLAGVSLAVTGTASGSFTTRTTAGHWRSAAAISSITAFLGSGKIVSGSKIQLYGIS